MAEPVQSVKPKGAGPGRTSTSCSECQRRKQKCDKQWPCRHCQDRRVPHLCQFKKRGSDCEQEQQLKKPAPRASSPPKRKYDEFAPGNEEASAYVKKLFHIESTNLADLGYVPSGRQPGFQQFLAESDVKFTSKAVSGIANRMDSPNHGPLPPRPYADVLIHNFCDNINHVYCIVHPESLLEEYAHWWQTHRTKANPELESLLLRLCAISAQFLPEPICERLETEMSEDLSQLKHKWHESAEQLSNSVRPGKGGTKHVQQLFLTASYYKTEAMFVESWHALAGAIRIAQEIGKASSFSFGDGTADNTALGMHKDSPDPSVTDFDREIRRSVWMSLYTWDRMMAFIFDRPAMIDRAHCKLIEPKLNLWNDPIHPELPSPILSRVFEFRLAKVLDKYLDMEISEASIGDIVKPLRDVKKWLEGLPAVFHIRNPDTSFDECHRRVRLSRLGMHTTSYIVLFHLLQHCLVKKSFPAGSTEAEREKLRDACSEYCLRMTDVVDRLASSVSHSRFHMSFCLFETCATACAALVKDRDMELPRRKDIARAMGRAESILIRLAPTTAVARSSGKVLTDLMAKLQIDQPDMKPFIDEGRQYPLFPGHENEHCQSADSALGSSKYLRENCDRCLRAERPNLMMSKGIASPESYSEAAKPSPEPTFVQKVPSSVTAGSFGELDLSVVDDIWDWENFDFQVDLNVDLNAAMLAPQFLDIE